MQKLKDISFGSKLILIIIAIIILMIIGFYYADANTNKTSPLINISEQVTNFPDENIYKYSDEYKAIFGEIVKVPVRKGKSITNILLIGMDKGPGESSARSYSIILVSVNKKTDSIKLISLMRDMYIEIPGYNDNRINASYAFGGAELLTETINNSFMIPIDGCAEIEFSGFSKVIDIMGGIDIELNKDEALHLNKENRFNLVEGTNHLTGDQALAYSRIRYVGNADYERTERQRKVLVTIYNKFKDSTIKTIYEMAKEILPLVSTDLSTMQLINLTLTVMRMATSEIETYRIPAEGEFTPATINGMSVLLPDIAGNTELLKEYIGN